MSNDHIEVVLSGEPTAVGAAFNHHYFPSATTGSIALIRPIQAGPALKRLGWEWGRYDANVITLGKIEAGGAALIDNKLSQLCGGVLDPDDTAYATSLIEVVYASVKNLAPLGKIDFEHPRFQLSLIFKRPKAKLVEALQDCPRLDAVNGIGLRDGTLKRANDMRPEVLALKARDVLGDFAAEWLRDDRWHVLDGGHWHRLVELDFIQANRDAYLRQLRKRREAVRRAALDPFGFSFVVRGGRDSRRAGTQMQSACTPMQRRAAAYLQAQKRPPGRTAYSMA